MCQTLAVIPPRRRNGVSAASLLVAALVAALVGACGSPTLSAPPADGPGASPSASMTGSTPGSLAPSPSPSPATSPSAAPTPSPGPTATPAPGVVGLPPEPTRSPRDEPRAGDGIFLETGRVRIPGTDARITLPNDWWTVDIDGQDLAAIIDALPRTAAGGLSDEILALVAERLSLVAVDLQRANRGASATAVTVDLAVPAGPFAATVLAAGVDVALQAAGVRDARTRALTIDGHVAVRADYRVRAGSGGDRQTYLVTQVYVALDGEVLVVTIAIPTGGQPDDADRIVRSIDVR